jgi:hypothetical protein
MAIMKKNWKGKIRRVSVSSSPTLSFLLCALSSSSLTCLCVNLTRSCTHRPWAPRRRPFLATALVVFAALTWTSPLLAQDEAPLSLEAKTSLFEEGKLKFRQGLEALSRGEKERGRVSMEEAAALFTSLLERGGIENGYLRYNIGNCHFWLDDIGRAIASYRRAESTIPTDPDLRQNLHAARQKCVDRITKSTESKLLETLFFWHYSFPVRWKIPLLLALHVATFSLLITRLFVRRASLRFFSVVAGSLAVILLVSVAIDLRTRKTRVEGVILDETVVARKGDGKSYEPAFETPLHAGTEWELVEKRGGWLEIRLADGRQCWVEREAVELL